MARILIVDDEKVSGELLKKKLQSRGMTVDYVMTVDDCFKAITSHEYDLVLLDIMMPEVNELDHLVKIRKQFNSFELPIVMATAKTEIQDIVEALKLGANDYLTKPVNIDLAMARIQTQVKLAQLNKENVNNQKTHALNTMISTLNHQINNPLAIAIGNLSLGLQKMNEDRWQKTVDALNRITDIVKKVDKLTSNELQEMDYSEGTKMYKIE